jgi:D-xylose transport system permease protein
MDLIGYASPVKFMVTGAVLLAAVIVDAIARDQRQAAGRVYQYLKRAPEETD